MMLFGWTDKQWAIVLAAFPLKAPTVESILESRSDWLACRPYAPGEEKLSKAPEDWDAVRMTSTIAPWMGDKIPPPPERPLIMRLP